MVSKRRLTRRNIPHYGFLVETSPDENYMSRCHAKLADEIEVFNEAAQSLDDHDVFMVSSEHGLSTTGSMSRSPEHMQTVLKPSRAYHTEFRHASTTTPTALSCSPSLLEPWKEYLLEHCESLRRLPTDSLLI